MINPFEIIETINMIDNENLDIRTITMGISLKSCAGPDIDKVCENVYNKITTYAKDLVKTGEDIEKEFGIPFDQDRHGLHLSSPSVSFLPVTARKTSSIFPLVIS